MPILIVLIILAGAFFVFQWRGLLKDRDNELTNPNAHAWRKPWNKWVDKELYGQQYNRSK